MSNIRVTYSGLISFLVSVLSVITGTVFVIMVTRKLTPDELGLWALITAVVGYVLIIQPIVSYWTTRQIARGEKVGKSSMFTGSFMSLAGIIAYLIISYTLSIEIDTSVLILGAILVPISFFQGTLSGIALGYKPHSTSFGSMAFEITKIPIGLVLVVFLQFGIVGALLTVILAGTIRIMILVVMLREQLIGVVKREIIKFWFKMSWIPMYAGAPWFILSLDVLIFISITNSLVGLAYWTIGITIATLISQSGSISQALYPKLIATGKKEYAEENFKRTLYFAIPVLAVSIILAKPLLHIINPIYIDGVVIVYFLTLKSFVAIFGNMSFDILRAFEKIDLDKTASFKQYMKSKLFFVPTITFFTAGAYITALIIFLFVKESMMSEIELVSIWSLIFFLVLIPQSVFGLILIRKEHKISIPYKPVLKFIICTIIASIPVYLISKNMIIYDQSIWNFLPQIILIVLIGGIIYFSTTFLVDKSVRVLFYSVINEIKGKRHNS